jgi:glycosyltransferase involved in cell wall biosynthesis
MDKPLISLIVPCYNVEKLCDRFFQSLLEQTYSRIQLILINDGSTDGTEQKLYSYKDALEKKGYIFEYIYQENRGLGGAINSGLKRVRGEYLCWADPDDYYEKNAFEIRLNYFREHPDCNVLTADAYVRNIDTIDTAYLLSKDFDNRKKKRFKLLLDGNSIFCSGCHMVKIGAFKKANPCFDIYEARRGQNWQLLLPLYYDNEVDFLSVPIYNYIIYRSSMSHSDHSYEDKLKRMEEHDEIKINTISRLLISNEQKMKWIMYVSRQTLRLKLFLAVKYKNGEDYKSFYQQAREQRALSGIDLIRIFKMKLSNK